MGATVGQELLGLSGTPDFTPLESSWFHRIIIYALLNLSWDYVYRLMTGLFVWISRTALSEFHENIDEEYCIIINYSLLSTT